MRSRVRHELKTWPEFFAATRRGHKHFELRRDDRPEGFQVGDELLLKEWDPAIEEPYGPGEGGKYKGYTGREVLVRVDYVMPDETFSKLIGTRMYKAFPQDPGFVIMSVSLIP
jgi:hypothetical protein